MEESAAREQICETGRELLSSGLVARTWGNVSCRADDSSFLITPSGLDYNSTTPDDIARVQLKDMKWQGRRKPSSEKGVHAAAYEIFPEVGFVIHTHQTCASALGLAGFDSMDVSEDELGRLGGIARASYGLPGQKKLRNAVAAAMSTGARTVFMVNHGAVICGTDKADAMAKALLLEEVCRRNLQLGTETDETPDRELAAKLLTELGGDDALTAIADASPIVAWANTGLPLRSQLDDMAQMLGQEVESVEADAAAVSRALQRRDAVLVKGVGAVVRAGSADDADALKLLLYKAAICALHTRTLGVDAELGAFDVGLMHLVYKKKYSKQKGKSHG